jgi:hypothetical protein
MAKNNSYRSVFKHPEFEVPEPEPPKRNWRGFSNSWAKVIVSMLIGRQIALGLLSLLPVHAPVVEPVTTPDTVLSRSAPGVFESSSTPTVANPTFRITTGSVSAATSIAFAATTTTGVASTASALTYYQSGTPTAYRLRYGKELPKGKCPQADVYVRADENPTQGFGDHAEVYMCADNHWKLVEKR